MIVIVIVVTYVFCIAGQGNQHSVNNCPSALLDGFRTNAIPQLPVWHAYMHLLQCLLFELTPLFFSPHLHVVVAAILLQMTDQISCVSTRSLKRLAATVTSCRLVITCRLEILPHLAFRTS